MDSEMRAPLSSVFSEDVLRASYPLGVDWTTELAWKYEDTLKAIEYLAERGYAILGGDAYRRDQDQFIPTLDNWSVSYKHDITWEQYVAQSEKKARAYLEKYWKDAGDEYYYVLVFCNENEYLS